MLGPWNLQNLQQAPEFERTNPRRVRDFDRDVIVEELYFGVEPFLGKPARAFGYLARPVAQDERLPAMLLIHGGGGTAMQRWARLWSSRGFAALAIELYGQGPNQKRLPDGGCNWDDMDIAFEFTRGVENSWIYHSVATSIRAISVLRELPEINPRKIGVTGVSWGGYLSSGVMSIDDRVALGIPMCGCGFDRRAGHAHDASKEKSDRVFTLFDPSNYFDRCTKPVLWLGGIWDPPPDQLMRCHRAVPGEQTLSIRVQPHHNDPNFMGIGYEQCEGPIFADSVLRGGDPLPKIGAPQRNGRIVSAPCEAAAGIFGVAVHWTEDLSGPWNQRRWSSAWRERGEKRAVAEMTTDAPAIAFLTVVDERGALASSAFIGIED